MRISLLLLYFAFFNLTIVSAQTLNWTGFPAGGTSYTSGITTVTVTSSAPGFQNGTPKYYAAATVGSGECGIAGGLALEHNFGNITTAFSQVALDFTSGGTTNGLCGNIAFQIKDINSEESNQTFADWVEVWAIDGNNNAVPVANITATGGSNKTITTSGNTRVVVGHTNGAYGSRSSTTCDNVNFSVTPATGTTLKVVYIKYHPEYTASPNDYYNFTGPKRPAYQYISISPITINATAGPTAIQLTTTPASCANNDGSVSIGTVTGGVSPYQYNFNNSGLSTTSVYGSLSAGSYAVTVVDNAGCSFSSSATVTQQTGPTAIQISTTPASCGQQNGSVTLGNVTGGAAPYQYNFNSLGYSTSTNYSNLSAGTYPIIVKDVNGCTYSTTTTISNAAGPTAIQSQQTADFCAQANGTISITNVTGGTAPYQYNLNNQGWVSTTNFNNLAAASYSLDVKDNNGCTYSTSITITAGTGPTNVAYASSPANCGQNDGAVTIGTITGGTAPYQYNFNNAGYASTLTYSSLLSGTYPLSVKDANGCVYAVSVSVSSSAAGPNAVVANITDAHCGNTSGYISLGAVSGGSAPYQYDFNNVGFQSNTNFLNLSGGSYNLTIKDNGGCTFDTVLVVQDISGPTQVAYTVVAEKCNKSNGSLQISSVTGGISPYTYSFNNAPFSSTQSYTNLAAGIYLLSVQDNFGCSYSEMVTVNEINGPSQINSTFAAETCGQQNGSISITSITGGTAPYTYSFNNLPFTSTAVLGNLSAGNYILGVNDANGCQVSSTVTLNGTPAGPTQVDIATENPQCGALEGSVVFNVSGGTAPYQFSIDGSQPFGNNTVSAINIGNYSLLVSDLNGCTITKTFAILPSTLSDQLHIPNVFTPNADASNPVWFVEGTCVQEMTGVIINRWGETMKTLSSIADNWDGTSKGKEAIAGVYFYKIEVTFSSGKKETHHGNITLIR